MSDKKELTEEFKIKYGIDLTDFEIKGKFPKFDSNKQRWGVIERGTAWKMYAEFLESKLDETNQRHEERHKEGCWAAWFYVEYGFEWSEELQKSDFQDESSQFKKWYNEKYESDD